MRRCGLRATVFLRLDDTIAMSAGRPVVVDESRVAGKDGPVTMSNAGGTARETRGREVAAFAVRSAAVLERRLAMRRCLAEIDVNSAWGYVIRYVGIRRCLMRAWVD